MKVFRAIEELCSGCRMCEIMCSLSKTGTVNRYRARIRVVASEEGIHSPIICQHCENPPCQEACPVPGAMYIDSSTGAVVVDDSECTGCLACVEACPAKARIFGDLDDPYSEASRALSSRGWSRLREEMGTNPKVFYLPR